MKTDKNQYSVLLVDDYPENIEVLAGSLQGTGYHLMAANSGKEALRLARSDHQPDLILLDVMMPEIDGHDVCRSLKEDPRTKNIPVIFITALVSPEDEALGFSLGAVDYIHKPISPPIVRARVATHLALAHQNRELERRVANATKEISETRREIIRRLAVAGEYHDNETGAHVIRVGMYVEHLALAKGLDPAQASLLKDAAEMHDVGKIGIPDSILLKPGQYSAEERAIMQRHCEIGAEILGDHQSPILVSAKRIAYSHHEKWNGEGYPLQLKGEQIPYEARLASLADVFDALVSKRPYKEPWPFEKAAELIQSESGKSFDPDVVTLFNNLTNIFYDILNKIPDQ
jgi:putative two-component system response regulator